MATLKSGALCGEMSLIRDEPTNATVRASDSIEALILIRSEFQKVMDAHPGLAEYLEELSDERLQRNFALLYDDALLEDDEHILI